MSSLDEVLSDLRSEVEDYFETGEGSILDFGIYLKENWKTVYSIALGGISICVTLASGIADAERIVGNEPACKRWDIFCPITTLKWLYWEKGDSQGRPKVKAFVIPTLNVASLEFSPDCGHAKMDGNGPNARPSARKYVDAAIRQDVGGADPTNLLSCLVHVGTTDSAQFLLDFDDDDPPTDPPPVGSAPGAQSPPDFGDDGPPADPPPVGSASSAQPPPVDVDIRNCGGSGKAAASSGGRGSTPPSVPLREKLGAQLLSLVESYEDGGSKSVLAYARSNSLDLTEMRVAIRVLAASEQDVSCLERQITDAGGSIESNFENSIFAAMPVDALRAFAASEAVWRVDGQQRLFAPPGPPEPIAENPQDPKEDEE